MMKKLIVAIILIGVITLFSGCKAKEATTKPDIINLGNRTEKQAVEAYGILRCMDTVDITMDFSASVAKVNVKNGQKVAKGDTLMELELVDYNLQMKELETELELLKEQSEVSELPKEKLSLLEEKLSNAKGKLDREYFTENRIVAEFENGIAYNLDYTKGDILSPGCRLLTLADLDSIRVMADIDQQYIGYVKLGAAVDVVPEYNKNITLKGTVSYISSKAFFSNGETVVPVEITFQEKMEGLIPDSDVQVKIYPAK